MDTPVFSKRTTNITPDKIFLLSHCPRNGEVNAKNTFFENPGGSITTANKH
jgi:hypothetical protein